jgi:phage gp46-like protein
MSDIAIAPNLNNGRQGFAWADGDVVFDDTLEHEVLSRLVEWRGRWWADSRGTHGSRLFTIKHLSASTTSDAEAYAREALQPMVDAKRLTIVAVRVTTLSGTQGARLTVAVSWKPLGGDPIRTTTVFV